MFSERLMAAGSWTLELQSTTPETVKAITDVGFVQVIVTSVRVDASAMPVASLLAIARYRGVFRRRSEDRLRWEGAGLAVLLGDEDGRGNTYIEDSDPSKRPVYDNANTSWIRNGVLRNGSGGANGITVGTGTASSATPTKAGKIEAGDSPRDVLNMVCDIFSTSGSNPYEWRLNHDGTLDVAARNTLFTTTVTPTTLATRRTNGFSAGSTQRLLPITRFDNIEDWESYATEVTVAYTPKDFAYGVAYVANDCVLATSGIYYECTTGHTSSGANQPPNASFWQVADEYGTATQGAILTNDLDGSDLVMRQVSSSRGARTFDDADAVAERKLGRFDDVDRRPSMSTAMYDVGRVCRPGDAVQVYDEASGLVDLTAQVDGGAGLVFPLSVRVQGLDWPVRKGMGVYTYTGTGSPTDITDSVVFETGDARVDVGAPRHLLLGDRPRFVAA